MTDTAIPGIGGWRATHLARQPVININGGYYLDHELKRTGPLYGIFALVLGLLAWLYLGATFTIYAAEVNVVKERKLLPRAIDELALLLPNYFVADAGGRLVGCAALEIYSSKLAEVRSLVVVPEYQGHGVGKQLVEACINRAREERILEIMAITSSEEFFRSCGFDFTLSSLPWWDGRANWLVEEYDALSRIAPVIAQVDSPARIPPASLKSRLLLKPLLRSQMRHWLLRVRPRRKFLRVPRVGEEGRTQPACGLAAAGLPTR